MLFGKFHFLRKILKVLITGATGFVGSHVADLMKEKGYDIRCTIRKTSNLRWLKDKGFELVEASLSNPDSLRYAVNDVDIVIHSAGLVAAKNYQEFLKGNRDGTKNLIEAVAKFNPNIKRFLFVSSQTAVGPSESLDIPKTEESPVNPITAYGKSKIAAEQEVLKFKNYLPITIVRPSAVYGPRDTATFTIFQTVNKGFATIIGFKPKYVNLIHAADLKRGIVAAVESDNTMGETYFLASEEIYKWNQLMSAIVKAFDKKRILTIKVPHSIVYSAAALSEFFGRFSQKPPVFNFDKGRDFVQTYWTCSVEKAKKDFGFKQSVKLEDGMKETADWYKDNHWL